MTAQTTAVTAAGNDAFTNEYEQKAAAFHAAFDIELNVPVTADLLRFRKTLIAEEIRELFEEIDRAAEALETGGEIPMAVAANLLKETADVQYVLSGMSVTFGWPIAEVYSRVHDSNMSKLGADGRPVRREDGKVLKGPAYFSPILDDLVQK